MELPVTMQDEIRERLRNGDKPAMLAKIYGKDVYRVIRGMLVEHNQAQMPPEDSIPPNTPVTELNEDDLELEPPPGGPMQPKIIHAQGQTTRFSQVKRGTPLKRTVQAVEVNLPDESLEKVRGIYSMIMVPRVLSMPMPDLLYKAMIISIVEFGFPEMRPNDFIDTVIAQWLEACGIVTPEYMRQDDIDNAAKLSDEEAQKVVEDYVKANKLMTYEDFMAKYKLKETEPSNNGGNGHNGNGHKDTGIPVAKIEPQPTVTPPPMVLEKPVIVTPPPVIPVVDVTVVQAQIQELSKPETKPAQTVQDLFKNILTKEDKK